MLPEKRQNKELSIQQKTFINALFGEAKGNPKKAAHYMASGLKLYTKNQKTMSKTTKLPFDIASRNNQFKTPWYQYIPFMIFSKNCEIY